MQSVPFAPQIDIQSSPGDLARSLLEGRGAAAPPLAAIPRVFIDEGAGKVSSIGLVSGIQGVDRGIP